MWIMVLGRGGIEVCTRPMAFDIMQEKLNSSDPVERAKWRARASGLDNPDGCAWDEIAVELGVSRTLIEDFFKADFTDIEVIIEGGKSAVTIAEKLGGRDIIFVSRIADEVCVDYMDAPHENRLYVMIGHPETVREEQEGLSKSAQALTDTLNDVSRVTARSTSNVEHSNAAGLR